MKNILVGTTLVVVRNACLLAAILFIVTGILVPKTASAGVNLGIINAIEKTEDKLIEKMEKMHTIGESYGGGIVFYVYDGGQHGLIAATADQCSVGIQWYNGFYITTGATKDGVGEGKANTELIISKQGAGNYAAQICADYRGGGYDDWYLPSKYELNLLYQQKSVVGGFASYHYWSSTEYNSGNAWTQLFDYGAQYYASKANTLRVRAVRAF